MERLLEEASFSATDSSLQDGSLMVDASYVDEHLGELSQDEDLSRFIL
jgi:ATP-dependent HslUV protease ATP-binding subunit HslU